MFEEFFPQKLALADNFCNRQLEKNALEQNIIGTRPTLIVSPRRYGKTSLGVFVIKKMKIPFAHLDLFPLASHQDVQNTLLAGIGDILTMIESVPKKAMNAIAHFFSELNVSFKFVGTRVEVDITQKETLGSATLLSALKKLEMTLEKKRKKAVFFLDEFQRLSQMNESEMIEGVLRYVAQQSNHIAFIFSGSNRHLLNKMFYDSTRPLYKLCDKLTLERILAAEYIQFLNGIAKQTFKKTLDEETIHSILQLTECHPYYVNVLCHRLWRQGKVFSTKEVTQTFYHYAVEEKSTVFKELESLSQNQLKLLISLARVGFVKEPFGDEFVSYAGMPLSSLRQSFNNLIDKDYIYLNYQNKYGVLDPLIKYILSVRPK